MFEIHKRHTPMFVTSEIRQIAELMVANLDLENLFNGSSDVEINPIFQTARINEINPFIVRTKLSFDAILKIIHASPTYGKLQSINSNPWSSIEKLIGQLKSNFGLDSYLLIGEQNFSYDISHLLAPATEASIKPLIIFCSSQPIKLLTTFPKLFDFDHPAIWLEDGLRADMSETEAFFSITPTLKLEVELNRFKILETFGQFAAGLVRF